MRDLVMDGVRAPRVGGANSVAAVLPVQNPVQLFRPESARLTASVDGLRRVRPLAAVVDAASFGQAEKDLEQDYIRSAIRSRYRLAGMAAAGLLIPLLALPVRQLLADRAAVTTESVSTPAPVSDVRAPIAAVQASQPQTDPALQELLREFTAVGSAKAAYGIVVKDLKSGITTAANPDQAFTSASLYKLFVAHGIYKLIDNGSLSLGDPVRGTGRNVADCLRVMINVSDNTCGRALGNILGWGKQDATLHNLGFANTSLTDPQRTSAGDVALLLERLYKGTLLSPSSSEQLLALLKDQRVNNRLPVGLPAGTVIAHKTGDLNGYVHDAGIVYGPKTDYLIIVSSGPWTRPSQAPASFADISAKVFAHFNK